MDNSKSNEFTKCLRFYVITPFRNTTFMIDFTCVFGGLRQLTCFLQVRQVFDICLILIVID